MIKKVLHVYKASGIRGVFRAVLRRFTPKRAECLPLCKKLLSNGVGLEIGGPSGVFQRSGILPIYSMINRLDNCNFSDQTTWEGTINEGMTFQYDVNRAPGRQYISEASDLQDIPSATYDFLLSSHVIEHVANPLQALSEWIRVLSNEGILILLVPHKEGTFDHKRPVTSFDHLIADVENNTKEDDRTHLPEILAFHDLERDPAAGSLETFKQRSEKNVENRCLHHHVFDTALTIRLLSHMNLQIHAIENALPFHIIAIAQKTPLGQLPDNQAFFDEEAEHRRRSPFVSDKHPLAQGEGLINHAS
ncbi:MAG TPA: methyltransferase [Betaproteobacteria bacterium]|nr:methyltransferase [Betaproteobacteria bacterium]